MILIYYIFQVYSLILLARVLMSWIPNIDPYNPIVQFIYNLTEPVLKPVRDILRQNFNTGSIDFSPLIVLIIMQMLMRVLFF